ncbi:two-component system sensor histidine kinase YesM [Paenibacillus phyllosphaerae]|uniref:Two-component system sensor histidine kinase YesM n=1 Tax=Paenibacillus phyllosphaerae TaxID=274593 RepID=A0A7W5B0F6_9BACL|nr:sensor histidine kinase [Paenibacillus phyllosphaerae]MBB3112143.1 two-component system sensor histidine kinase YesM [Paenibacillus phyllosphaerae]
MRKWLYSSTFRKRIWLSISMFTAAALIVSGIISSTIASNILEKKSYSLNQGMVDKSAQALEEKLRKIRLAVLTFVSSDQFNQLIARASSGEQLSYYDHFTLNKSLQTPIFQMQLIEPGITSFLIHTPIGEFYSNSSGRNEATLFEKSNLFHYLDHKLPTWVESHEDDLFVGSKKVLSLLFEPYIQNTSSNMKMVVNVSETALRDYLMMNNDEAVMMLFTENSKLAFETDPITRELSKNEGFTSQLMGKKGHFDYTFKGEKYLVNYSTVSYPDNWLVVHLMRRDALLRDVRLIQWMTVSTIVLFVLLTLLISGRLTSRLLKPLNNLQSVMKKVEQDDLKVRFVSEYKDEFTHVGLRLNSMLDRIGLLIQERTEAEKAERMAELKALQAQINPHFLYNTLNTILWKSFSNEHNEVRQMIVSLSKLFRLGLNNGDELTNVDKEIEHVSEYLLIQKMCYTDLFEFEIECDDEVKDFQTLKLLLQPLVENSILHGFKDLHEKGLIRISVIQEHGVLTMRVEDNGQGFDAVRKMDQFNMSESSSTNGFALHNIYKRVQLYYGHKAGFTMSSVPYDKTIIQISIPVRAEGEGFE